MNKKTTENKRCKVYNIWSLTLREKNNKEGCKTRWCFRKNVRKRTWSNSDLGHLSSRLLRKFFFNFFYFRTKKEDDFKWAVQINVWIVFSIFSKLVKKKKLVITRLIEELDGYKPDIRTVKVKLIQKYSNNVLIFDNCGKEPFYVWSHLVINWYINRNSDVQEERLRIVRTAAEIIREDLWSQFHDCSSYESSNDFLKMSIMLYLIP